MIKTIISSIKDDQDQIKINLVIDISTFNQLAKASVDSLKDAIDQGKKQKDFHKLDFLFNLSPHIEIIEHFVLLESENATIKISQETKNLMKNILPEVNKVIEEIGNSDDLLLSIAETVKASPKVMQILGI